MHGLGMRSSKQQSISKTDFSYCLIQGRLCSFLFKILFVLEEPGLVLMASVCIFSSPVRLPARKGAYSIKVRKYAIYIILIILTLAPVWIEATGFTYNSEYSYILYVGSVEYL